MPIHRFFLSDFVEIQRKSFFELLEKGLIDEFSKRNPITNVKKDLELFFYPEYYRLTPPESNPHEAILKGVSYTSKLYIPVQLTDKKSKTIKLKWSYIGNLPLMTKRGHFILNGAARVIVNQILRSPGIYYQQKLHENFSQKWSQKPETSYKRYYADLICLRGTWLRIEIDKDKNIWAQTKKGPKIPILWFLLAMGLTERIIFKSILEPNRLVQFAQQTTHKKQSSIFLPEPSQYSPKTSFKDLPFQGKKERANNYKGPNNFFGGKDERFGQKNQNPTSTRQVYVKNPPEAWKQIYSLVGGGYSTKKILAASVTPLSQNNDSLSSNASLFLQEKEKQKKKEKASQKPKLVARFNELSARAGQNHDFFEEMQEEKPRANKGARGKSSQKSKIFAKGAKIWHITGAANLSKQREEEKNLEDGRKWIFNKFMNPRTYDLGKQGRLAFNRKLGLNISSKQLTLTPQDLLYATDYLIKVEKGLKNIDDIDHLKNRRVRTSGELIQIQLGTGLVRLEKAIRDKMNKSSSQFFIRSHSAKKNFSSSLAFSSKMQRSKEKGARQNNSAQKNSLALLSNKGQNKLTISNLINSKAFNSALREFFGTSQLSQFMDQINPLAEITHKRRLSSMGPGGVTRDTATLAIRGIHPTHYGRICPVETPEGKNTGLVNSMTTYARVNSIGILESPFYKVYKGQVQKSAGMFFLSAEHEEKIKLAAADLFVSPIGFLPKSNIPVRIAEDFTKIARNDVQYIGISPIQMISIATSLIPFLEHDDANRALMGSNMQRQAVPLLRAERPIVGTGLEARAVSDSGHVIQSKFSGLITYVSGEKIIVTTQE